MLKITIVANYNRVNRFVANTSKVSLLLKLFVAFLLSFATLSALPKLSHASEGTTEVRSITNEDYRCFASSLLLLNKDYKILVSCRDLIYPPEPNVYSYVMWGTKVDATDTVKLGELGVGKAEFTTKEAFSNLFVTVEPNPRTRAPTGNVVMQGTIEPLAFLDRPISPTPTIEGGKLTGQPEEEIKITTLSTRERLFLGLRRAGLVSLLALVAIIGLIFVITRARG